MTGEENTASIKPLDLFYYLTPIWLLAELFFWPGFRAGVIFGNSAAGVTAFYCAEGLIGAALWKKLRYAELSALTENALYLLFVLKYILYAPLDAAMALDSDADTAARFTANYVQSLPGILYSMLHVVLRLKANIQNLRGA